MSSISTGKGLEERCEVKNTSGNAYEVLGQSVMEPEKAKEKKKYTPAFDSSFLVESLDSTERKLIHFNERRIIN